MPWELIDFRFTLSSLYRPIGRISWRHLLWNGPHVSEIRAVVQISLIGTSVLEALRADANVVIPPIHRLEVLGSWPAGSTPNVS